MNKGVLVVGGLLVAGGLGLGSGCATHGSGGSYGSGHGGLANGAVCAITATAGNDCEGTVRFMDTEGGALVTAEISGLAPGQRHGFHIHEFAFSGSDNGTCTGGHYDPTGSGLHALPGGESDHHAGDMGNLVADGRGRARYEAVIPGISLTGHNAIIGRAIIVHGKADDGGQPTGNAGSRIGVGTIGVSAGGDHGH